MLPTIRSSRLWLCAAVVAALTLACQDDRPAPTAPRLAASGGSDTVVVDSVSPDNGPRGATLDVEVRGSGFTRSSRADFALDGVVGPGVVTNSTRYVNSGKLVANVTIAADAEVDLYDVIVTSATKKPGIGTEMFAVTPAYQDLGTLGGDYTAARGVNANGQVVGFSRTGGCGRKSCAPTHAFLWDGVMHDLGALPGWSGSGAWGINDLGVVVGDANVNGIGRAWFWTAQCGTVLLPELAGVSDYRAFSISNAGLVVGEGRARSGMLLVWDVSAEACQVNSPEVVHVSTATAPGGAHKQISETGRIVQLNAYYDRDAAGWHRFEFGPWPGTYATDIAGDGQAISGYGSSGCVVFAASPNGAQEPLPSIGTGPCSEPMLNQTGDIAVGGSKRRASDSYGHAVIWRRGAGSWTVQRLGEPNGSMSTQGRAVANAVDGGVFVAGDAMNGSSLRAFLWRW